MNIDPWSPCGQLVDIAATTTGGTNRQALNGATATSPGDVHVRVVNGGSVPCIVAFGDITVDASTDTRRVEVAPGERILSFKQGSGYADAIMRSGTGTVSVQLGFGV